MPEEKLFPDKRLDSIMAATYDKMIKLRDLKGAEYAGTVQDDCLANFRRNAKDCGITMETCWRVYAGKHWDAISQYVRDIQSGTTREVLEPIEGRVDDLLVYLMLFKAMIIERRDDKALSINTGSADKTVPVFRHDPSDSRYTTQAEQNHSLTRKE